MADYFDPNNPFATPAPAGAPAPVPAPPDNNVSYVPRRQQLGAMGDPGYFSTTGGTPDTTIDPSLAQPRPYRGPLGAIVPEAVAGGLQRAGSAIGDFVGRAANVVRDAASNLNFSNFMPFGIDRNPPPNSLNPITPAAPVTPAMLPFNPAPGDIATSAPAPVAGTPGMTDAQRMNAPFHADYLRMLDQDRVDAATAAANQQAGIKDARLQQNEYDARVAAQQAGREADHANFEASINAGVGRGNARSRALAADRANAARDVAQKNLTGAQTAYANGAPTDYLGDVAKGQATVNAGAQSRLTQAQGEQNLERGATDLQRQQQSAAILQRMTTTQDPKERAALQSSYLVSLGKDPKRYSVEHSNGPPVPDQFGNLHPGAQYVHIIDNVTGDVQTVKNGTEASGASPFKSQADAVAAAKDAIAKGAPKDAVNARLKQYGYGALD